MDRLIEYPTKRLAMASTESNPRLLLRMTEVAALLGLGRSTVYELVQRGELPVIHVGRAVRVPAAALERWVERQTIEAEELR
jgi:excisionase family DNA binding protein